MKLDKIDPFFQKEIKNLGSKISDKKKGFKVILSFKDIKSRDKFVSQNEKLKNLQKFDLIPSVSLDLNKEQIKEYEKEDLLERIKYTRFCHRIVRLDNTSLSLCL